MPGGTGVTAPMWQRTEIAMPVAPGPGGHVDRSWLHYTRSRAAYRHDPPWPAVADKLLTDDPDAHLLLLFYAGHPDCLDLLAHLRVEWPGRYVLAFHKHRCLADGNAERESQPYEDILWDAADIRLLTPHARADPLYRKFRLAHDLDHANYLLQSCVMGDQEIDQFVVLVDTVLAQDLP